VGYERKRLIGAHSSDGRVRLISDYGLLVEFQGGAEHHMTRNRK
jgi:hypothetical protein